MVTTWFGGWTVRREISQKAIAIEVAQIREDKGLEQENSSRDEEQRTDNEDVKFTGLKN